MESYKEINKELVQTIQRHKIEMEVYRKELISLRQQLMEERETRVCREKMLKSMLIHNFKSSIAAIDPDCQFINILSENCNENDEKDEKSPYPQGRLSRVEIFEQLRQSISIQRRESIVTSPNRRSSSRMSGLEPPLAMAAELEIDEHIPTTPQTLHGLDCIEENPSYSDAESDTQSDIQVVESSSDSDSNSSTITSKNLSTQEKESQLRDFSNLNIIDMQETAISAASPHISRNCVSIGPARRSGQQQLNGKIQQLNDEPFLNPERLTKEITVETTYRNEYSSDMCISAALSELSIGEFTDAPSSTPNHTLSKAKKASSPVVSPQKRPGRKKIKEQREAFSLITTQSKSTTPMRETSQRRCKPQNLAEPSLGKKLRNEMSPRKTKSKQKRKSKVSK